MIIVLQDVFPTDFGADFDNALQMLMLDFVSRLEKLLPVPDIQQVEELELHHSLLPFFLNMQCNVYSTEYFGAQIRNFTFNLRILTSNFRL